MAKKKPKKTKAKKIKSKKVVKTKKTKGKKILKKSSKKGATIAYLGLGSNVGDREEYVEQAVFLMEKNPHIEVIRRSTNYENEAEGSSSQPPYINAAVNIRTTLSPHKLLEVCQEIEATLGREREIEWGPRTIDIDILLYGDEIISDEKLQVPHPLMHERLFVLRPMKEIASSVIHPVLEKTMDALYEEKKAETGEKYDDELPGFREIKSGNVDDFERW